MKILIVDDELLIRNVIKEYASFEGYEIYEAEDGLKAIEVVSNTDIDLVILDIMMPKLDGFGTCREIKKNKNIPIIMLSARNDEYDKLFGFEMGIDDYITKPFSPKELIARIKAVLKRNDNNEENNFIYKDLIIDYKGHAIYIEGEEVKLTPKEYALMCYFVKNKNIALSREQLLSKIWGYDFFGDARTIDTHIKMLRNNLGVYRNLITTVRGLGYKFEIKEK